MSLENMRYCVNLLASVCDKALYKLFGVGVVVIIESLFGGGNFALIHAVFMLVCMDFVVGVGTAYKTGQEIKSSKILRSAIKMVIYMTLISASILTERAVQIIPIIDDTVIGFLAATELISIIEHAGTLGYAVPKKLLNKLKVYTESV